MKGLLKAFFFASYSICRLQLITMKNLIFAFLIFFLGCTKHQQSQTASLSELNPSGVVKAFVELSASARTTDDKKRLIESCGGDLRRAFERMSEEEFKLAYLSSQLKIEKIEIKNATTQDDTAWVHYQVTLENKQGTETTHEINEREVQLRKISGGWIIEAIRLKGTDKLAFTRGMMF